MDTNILSFIFGAGLGVITILFSYVVVMFTMHETKDKPTVDKLDLSDEIKYILAEDVSDEIKYILEELDILEDKVREMNRELDNETEE